MTEQSCGNCINLQAEVERLEIENQRLQVRVRKLEIEINRLLSIIYSVCQWCYGVAQNAAGQMRDHLARGKWAYLKGQYEVASTVYNALRGE